MLVIARMVYSLMPRRLILKRKGFLFVLLLPSILTMANGINCNDAPVTVCRRSSTCLPSDYGGLRTNYGCGEGGKKQSFLTQGGEGCNHV